MDATHVSFAPFVTKPDSISIHNTTTRSLFKVKKLSRVKTDFQIATAQEQINKTMFESLGSPKNKYISQKINKLSISTQHMFNRAYPTYKKTRTQQSTTIQASNFNSSLNSSTPMSATWKRYHSQQRKMNFQKAYVMNQRQKLARLLMKREEQQQDFSKLSQKIQIKLKTPVKPFRVEDHPVHISERPWYQKWMKSRGSPGNQKSRQVFMRLKTTEALRNRTIGLINYGDHC